MSIGPQLMKQMITNTSSARFELSALQGEISFSSIRDALVNKFCVEDCSGLYQDALLGCCTATMIKDTGMIVHLILPVSYFIQSVSLDIIQLL